MAYAIDGKIGIDLATTSTTPQFALGDTVRTNNDGVYVYVQANGAITQYHTVAIDENWQAASITTALANAGHKVGFAQVAFANDEYGWVELRGNSITATVAAACEPDVALYTSPTAGVLDDLATTTYAEILGITAVTSGNATSTAVEIIAGNVVVNL